MRLVKSLDKASRVTKFTLPDKGYIGEPVYFELAGHLEEDVPRPNFCVGLYYSDGPLSRVTVIWRGKSYEVERGRVFSLCVPQTYRCTSIDEDLTLILDEKGSYSFSALTGYVESGTFIYDDKVDKSIEVVEKPIIPGWPEWLPWWVLPLIGGIAVVGVIGGVMMYEEQEKLKMLLLLRRK